MLRQSVPIERAALGEDSRFEKIANPLVADEARLGRIDTVQSIARNGVRQALAALRPLFPQLDRAVARAAEIAAEEIGRAHV